MLRKGENATLGGGRVRVAVTAAGGAIDVSAVLLGDDRRVRSDDDLVFFNHPAQDGVALEGGEVVIDLDAVPADVSTIALVASVDGPGTFEGVTVRADVHGAPGFEAPAMAAGETVVVIVEVYRRAAACERGWPSSWTPPVRCARCTRTEWSLRSWSGWRRSHCRWTRDNVRMHEAVAADGSRVSLGGRNNEPQVIEDVLAHYAACPGEPVFVLFFSDGGVAKNGQIARLLREARKLTEYHWARTEEGRPPQPGIIAMAG
nr:VWA domain-containing protein [Actinomadura latina]